MDELGKRLEMGPDGRREQDEDLFHSLLSEHGTGWVQGCMSAHAPLMDENGAGTNALIGFTVAGMSAVSVVDGQAAAAIDHDHTWLFTFAASEEALDEIIHMMNKTRDRLKEINANARQLVLPAAGEADGDSDPGAELGEDEEG